MIHICTNCYKTFKTIQHLNQHKNRKFKCKSFTENSLKLSSIQSKTLSESKKNSNELENGVLTSNHSYCEQTDDDGGLIGTNNISLNSSPIIPENKGLNNAFDNLSIVNLLEIVGNHKQILEEKNKLENALVILKNRLEYLSKENSDLKNKINVVNDFISSYKN